MEIRFTSAARWQFRAALEALRRRSLDAAVALCRDAEAALRDPATLVESGAALPEFPGIPFREIVLASYRFFFRTEGQTVWIGGVWNALDE
jgi:plasmid stabilization system protein ParE